MTRVMGVDLGTKRTGVAISTAGVAHPLVVLETTDDLVDRLADLVREHGASEVVVGNPLRLDGSQGPGTVLARMVSDSLGAATGARVVLWDERLTTAAAERSLLGAGVRRRRRREVVDKVAAAVLLQGYLDARGARGERGGEGSAP
jgi:putative Holliday junction resolvase